MASRGFLTSASGYVHKRLALRGGALEQTKSKKSTKASSDLSPRQIEVRGAPLALKDVRDTEVLIDGPQGTGKTLGILAYLYELMDSYPGIRILVARRERASLTNTVLVTWENQIVPPGHPMLNGPQRDTRKKYRHVNRSEMVLGGFHTKEAREKIKSSEYDIIYLAEATEIGEADLEVCIGRLRHGKLPWQMLIADCNPHAPRHYLMQRVKSGSMRRLQSRHEDNPRWYQGGEWTQEGLEYLARLDKMTGARYLRYRLGQWAAAEGVVYDDFIEEVHFLPAGYRLPSIWKRYWVVDFGFTHPFVWQQWAQDEDGRLYRERELYRTKHLLGDNAAAIREATKDDPAPYAVICDHDAQDRAELEKLLGIVTIPAYKAVLPGINAVKERLRVQEDGRPRIFSVQGALIHAPDPNLQDDKRPVCSDDEWGVYEWAPSTSGRAAKDEPLKENDHGMDATRYMVAYIDRLGEARYDMVAGFGTVSSAFGRYDPR